MKDSVNDRKKGSFNDEIHTVSLLLPSLSSSVPIFNQHQTLNWRPECKCCDNDPSALETLSTVANLHNKLSW